MNATEVVTAERIETTPDALVIVVRGGTHRLPWDACSKRLARATSAERECAQLSPGGYGIHWPLLDEDLSIGGLLRAATG